MATTGFNAGLDSSDVILSYNKETTYATSPTTSYQKVRLTGEGFTENKSRTRPSEIEAKGQASAALTTQVEAGGSLNFGVSFGGGTEMGHDELLQSLINSADWSTAVDVGSPLPVTIAASTDVGDGNPGFTDSANGMVTAGIEVGMWVKVSGFTASPDLSNGFWRVVSIAAGYIGVDGLGAENIVVEAAGDAVNIQNAGYIRNSSVVNTFTIQKEMASNLFFNYPGSYPTGGTLSAAVGGFFEGSMNFIAKSEQNGTVGLGSPAYLEAPTGKIINTISGIVDPQYRTTSDYVSLTTGTILQGLSLNLTKENARLQFGIGSEDAAGMARGTLVVDGTASIYFKDMTLYNLYAAETSLEFAFRALDDTGAGYIISMPGVTLMNPNIVAGGPDTDLVAEFTLEGNPSVGNSGVALPFTIQVDRFA